jgi:putative acetyltransferase
MNRNLSPTQFESKKDDRLFSIIQNIRQHTRQLVRELDVLDSDFLDTGLNLSQCHALFEVEQQKSLNLMELCGMLCIDKSTASRSVKELIKKGLVKVSDHEADKRQKLFSVTPVGSAILQRNNVLANQQVEAALELLDESEQAAVERGLGLYAKALYRSRQQAAFEFRPIRREDNEKVARVIRTVMTEFGCVGEGYSINDPEVDAMFETYDNERSVFFVVTRQGEILGCGGIGPLAGGDRETCELKKMYFYPEARGKGLGEKMVSRCLQAAAEKGFKRCYLETVARMWQANLLYQKMGFEKICSPMGVTGHCSCENWYVKQLSPI